ncbi:DUF998 domain-containing protein [Arthrobacter sp. CC3]|uniref:DUF998 domain-containing protein n=1 Tax=Arthrobacter sp. CC3 TaxID=3029185 RepID=UPI0032673328
MVFWITQVALHVLRGNLSVVYTYVSDYANGPWGSLFIAGTMVHGIGNLAIAVGLGSALAPVRAVHAARAGVMLFVAAALGLFVAAIFPTDPAEGPPTFTGLVHGLAASGSFAVEFVALILLAVAFRADAAWRSYFRVSLVVTVTAGITLAWLLLAINLDWPPGLPERSALLAFTGWEFATAVLLARDSRPPESARHAPEPRRASG